MAVREWLALVAFASAIIFGTAGMIGMFRFPDPYARMHAGGLMGTTATFSVFIGSLLLAPDRATAARIVIIMIFFLISAPTGSYIVGRFTWETGLPVWKPKKRRNITDKEQEK